MSSCFSASSLSAAASSAAGGTGGGGLGSNEAVQRREGFAPRQSEPGALERAVAQIKPHRPRLGDLLRLIEVARRAVPVADGAAEGGAGEEAARDIIDLARALRRPSTASSSLATDRASAREVSAEAPLTAYSAAQGRDWRDRASKYRARRREASCSRRAISIVCAARSRALSGSPPRQQQVAVLIPLQRVQQWDAGACHSRCRRSASAKRAAAFSRSPAAKSASAWAVRLLII